MWYIKIDLFLSASFICLFVLERSLLTLLAMVIALWVASASNCKETEGSEESP